MSKEQEYMKKLEELAATRGVPMEKLQEYSHKCNILAAVLVVEQRRAIAHFGSIEAMKDAIYNDLEKFNSYQGGATKEETIEYLFKEKFQERLEKGLIAHVVKEKLKTLVYAEQMLTIDLQTDRYCLTPEGMIIAFQFQTMLESE